MGRRETLGVLCLSFLLFSGCTSKEEHTFFQNYAKEKQYNKKLLHTEKIQLYDANETQGLLTATYLFNKNDLKNKDEVFIVGFYLEDENAKNLLTKDFNLTLDGKLPKSVKILKKSDKHLKDIPFVTEWGDYFEVIFPHTQRKKFDLVFSSKAYGVKRLSFAKKAKYIFTKEPF